MKLLIRRYNTSDNLEDLLDIFEYASREGTLKDFPVDRDLLAEHLFKFIDRTIANSIFLVAYDEDELVGLLCAWHSPMLFAMPGYTVAHELPWCVKPCKNRGKAWFALLEAYEEWATGEGVDLLTLGNYSERLKPVYERKGYSLYFESMRKRLQ